MVKRQLADKLCCRRDAWLAASAGRQRAQVLFDGLEDGIRVELDVPHRLGEEGPFDLRKGQKQMLAGEQRVLAPARLVNGAVDDPSNRVTTIRTGQLLIQLSKPVQTERLDRGRQS